MTDDKPSMKVTMEELRDNFDNARGVVCALACYFSDTNRSEEMGEMMPYFALGAVERHFDAMLDLLDGLESSIRES